MYVKNTYKYITHAHLIFFQLFEGKLETYSQLYYVNLLIVNYLNNNWHDNDSSIM